MVISKYDADVIRNLEKVMSDNRELSLDPNKIMKSSESIRSALSLVEKERDKIETPPSMGVNRDLSGQIIRIVVLNSRVENLIADANLMINRLERMAQKLNGDNSI